MALSTQPFGREFPRRRVLQLLRERPMTAGELSEHFAVSKPTMSAHFAVLREADLAETERHGKTIIYRLKMSVLEDALLGFAEVFGMDLRHNDEALQADDEERKEDTPL